MKRRKRERRKVHFHVTPKETASSNTLEGASRETRPVKRRKRERRKVQIHLTPNGNSIKQYTRRYQQGSQASEEEGKGKKPTTN